MERAVHTDPEWYDESLDPSNPKYAVCFDLGRAFKDWTWENAEHDMRWLFTEFGSQLTWEEARSAIYLAWKKARDPRSD